MDQQAFNNLVNQLRADLAAELHQVRQTCSRAIEGLQADYDERLQAVAQYAYGELNNPDGKRLKSCVLPDGRKAHIIRETAEFIDVVAGDSLERWPLEQHSHIGETRIGTQKVTDLRQSSEVESENEDSLLPRVGEDIELPNGTVARVVEINDDEVLVEYDDETQVTVLISDLELDSGPVPLEKDEELVLNNGQHIVLVEVNKDGVITYEDDNGVRGRTTVDDLTPLIVHRGTPDDQSFNSVEGDADDDPEQAEFYDETGMGLPEPFFPLDTDGVEIEDNSEYTGAAQPAPPQTAHRAVAPQTVPAGSRISTTTPQPQETSPAPSVIQGPLVQSPVITASPPQPQPPPPQPPEEPLPPGIVPAHLVLVQRAAKLNAGPFQMSALPGFIEQLDGMTTEASSWVSVVQLLVDSGKLDYYEDDGAGQWFQSPDCTIPLEDAVWGIKQRQQQNAGTSNTRKQEREQIQSNRKRGAESRKSRNAVRHKPR